MTWGDVGKQLVGSGGAALIGFGLSAYQNNQNIKFAQGQANDQMRALQEQYEIAAKNNETLRLQAQLANQQNQNKPTSKTLLYVGLGLGGVFVLGVVIFAVTRR
jgi:hypothetical protein